MLVEVALDVHFLASSLTYILPTYDPIAQWIEHHSSSVLETWVQFPVGSVGPDSFLFVTLFFCCLHYSLHTKKILLTYLG